MADADEKRNDFWKSHRARLRSSEIATTHWAQSVQAIKDLASYHLLSLAMDRKPLPEQLALLICDLLDDRNRVIEAHFPAENGELINTFQRMQLLIDAQVLGLNSHGVSRFFVAALIESKEAPDPVQNPLSALSTAEIARRSKASRDSIAKWRKWPQYWSVIQQLRIQNTNPVSDGG